MMMPIEIDKYKIRSSFSKAATQYDRYALIQKETAAKLLDKIVSLRSTLNAQRSTFLDIGCGTGFLACAMAEAFPKTNIFGLDLSHAMTKAAKNKGLNRNIGFLAGDGALLPYKDETFDMIASNLAYQWFPDLDAAFSEAYRVLKPNGIIIFSTLGPKTLMELKHCYAETSVRFNKNGLPRFVDFSSDQTIQSSLDKTSFHNISIETLDRIKTYQDMWQLLKTVKSIGAGNPFTEGDNSLARGSLLKRMAEAYKDMFGVENGIYAMYELIFVSAIKRTPSEEPIA